MFGSGIYLSTDLGMSLGYSKTGLTWEKSYFGKQMSCVVLSEVLDHADVKLHTDGEFSTRKFRAEHVCYP